MVFNRLDGFGWKKEGKEKENSRAASIFVSSAQPTTVPTGTVPFGNQRY